MVPERYARYYLENAPSLLTLLALNAAALLVGIRFYVETMPGVATFLWPLYLDSPTAIALALASLLSLLTILGRPLEALPRNRATAYLHTLAFVWLVKYGLWTAVALTIGFDRYFPSLTDFWFIVLTHLAFVIEAYLIPHYGSTTRGALATALGLLVLNDLVDYGFGLHPPLRYEPGVGLAVTSVALSVLAVTMAARSFDRLESGPDAGESGD